MSEIDDEEIPQKFVVRHFSTMVLMAAVVGFMGIAWYSSSSNNRSAHDDDDLLVVEADKTPIKEKPVDAGGMKFPNQDKTVFETFSNSPPQVAKVERVLPVPEEPIKTAEASDIKVAASAEPSAGGNSSTDTDKSKDKAKSSEKLIETYKENHTDKASEVNTADTKKTAVANVDNKNQPIAKTPEKTVKAVMTNGSFRIQLGAFPNEAEAKKEWGNIQKKFPELSGKQSQIVKANVKGKNFYRLRVTGFSSTKDAKDMCSTLSGKGQACILPTG